MMIFFIFLGLSTIFREDKALTNPFGVGDLVIGQSLALNIEESGLTTGPMQFFVRQACVDLWNFLDGDSRFQFVNGPPGVGKSVEVYSYAINSALCKSKKLFYIRSSPTSVIVIYKPGAQGDMFRLGRFNLFNVDTAISWVQEVISNIDELVVDGTESDFITRLIPIVFEEAKVKLIVCTSFQAVDLSSEAESALAPDYFTMPSWTLLELQNACNSHALTLSDAELRTKYYFAGGSIRYILTPQPQLIKFLNNKISKVSNPLDILSGRVGLQSNSAVNSLMSVYPDRTEYVSTIVSEYVTRRLSNLCTSELVKLSRSIMQSNPSWQGWVTEMEVLMLIRKKLIKFLDEDDKEQSWVQEAVEVLADEHDTILNECGAGTYLIPEKWNQSAFDVIYKVSPHCVRFLQITNSETHSARLEYLEPFVTAMNAHVVEFIFICRRKNFTAFAFPNVDTKQLRDHLKYIHSQKKSNKKGKIPPPSFNFLKLRYYPEEGEEPELQNVKKKIEGGEVPAKKKHKK
jgi:hypothetical protein